MSTIDVWLLLEVSVNLISWRKCSWLLGSVNIFFFFRCLFYQFILRTIFSGNLESEMLGLSEMLLDFRFHWVRMYYVKNCSNFLFFLYNTFPIHCNTSFLYLKNDYIHWKRRFYLNSYGYPIKDGILGDGSTWKAQSS